MAEVTIITPGPLATIAQALRERLEIVFPKRFAHVWMPPRITRDVWRQLIRTLPMVGIGFNTLSRIETTGNLAVLTEWSIFVATKNEAGLGPLLFGDKFAPGFFSMAEVASAAVHGLIIPGQGTVQIKQASMAYPEEADEPGLAMASIELTVKADLSIANLLTGDGVTPGDLLTQQIDWSFDGGATVAQTDIINAGTT